MFETKENIIKSTRLDNDGNIKSITQCENQDCLTITENICAVASRYQTVEKSGFLKKCALALRSSREKAFYQPYCNRSKVLIRIFLAFMLKKSSEYQKEQKLQIPAVKANFPGSVYTFHPAEATLNLVNTLQSNLGYLAKLKKLNGLCTQSGYQSGNNNNFIFKSDTTDSTGLPVNRASTI